jgi:hypothetical protein
LADQFSVVDVNPRVIVVVLAVDSLAGEKNPVAAIRFEIVDDALGDLQVVAPLKRRVQCPQREDHAASRRVPRRRLHLGDESILDD